MNTFKKIFEQVISEGKNSSFEDKLNNFFKNDSKEIFNEFKLWAKKNKNQIERILSNVNYDTKSGNYREVLKLFYSFIYETYHYKETEKLIFKIAERNGITNPVTVVRTIGSEVTFILTNL